MPKIVNHEAYRQEIIQKATAFFVKQGYAGLGMREVAEHLGISKSALYHYFPSKEALFEGVIQAIVQADIALLDVNVLHALPFLQRFDALLNHILEIESWYIQQFVILVDYARIRGDRVEGNQALVSAGEAYIIAIAQALKVNRAEAEALYLQLTGVVLQRLFDGQHTDIHQAMAWLRQTLSTKYHGDAQQ